MQSANDFTLPIKQMQKRLERALLHAPKVVANEALNFALDNWKKQAFQGAVTEPWKKRKDPNKWGKVKRPGRGLLVDSGRLRRAGRVKSITSSTATLVWNVPYASAHNNGINGLGIIQNVNSFTRKRGKKTQTVSAHTRRINQKIPKRQFIGRSPYLTQRLQREVSLLIKKHLKQ